MDAGGQLDGFLKSLEEVKKGQPADLIGFLAERPGPDEMLSPWDAWCLIGLVRYRQRKIWAVEVVRTHLPRDPSARQDSDRFPLHPQLRDYGQVPGMPEWNYDLRTRSDCWLVNRADGEAIDVSFHEDRFDNLDRDGFIGFLFNWREPEPVVKRLKDLFWERAMIDLSLSDLVPTGAVNLRLASGKWPQSVQSFLSQQVLNHEADFDWFHGSWCHPDRRLWLAALIGDWGMADSLAGEDPAIRSITALRREWSCRIRRERLLAINEKDSEKALYGLADVGAGEDELVRSLEAPSLTLNLAALKAIVRRNDKIWCSHVHALLSRINRDGNSQKADIWDKCLAFLLEHGYEKPKMVKALSQIVESPYYQAALLALKHAPEFGLTLIRRSLSSPYFLDRLYTAIGLVHIGKPWCKRELRWALERSCDLEQTREFRTAIRDLGDLEFRAIVHDWENGNALQISKEKQKMTAMSKDLRRPEITEEDFLNSWSELVPELLHEIKNQLDEVRDVALPETEWELQIPSNAHGERPAPMRPWWKIWRNGSAANLRGYRSP